ncbi:hypothetical protein [Arthrobacter humicola]|uniref:hypothetical protein n=1 Tax=Arthrobacter humicola TaxID=409291 RepID=UPI001FADF39F|nr:hypothetical protein [Arthrobacter humicola]MCI9872743.1 hypothetical protein [Arthrobacter humicola]
MLEKARIPNHTSPRGRYCSASGRSFDAVEAQMNPVVVEPEPDTPIKDGSLPDLWAGKTAAYWVNARAST